MIYFNFFPTFEFIIYAECVNYKRNQCFCSNSYILSKHATSYVTSRIERVWARIISTDIRSSLLSPTNKLRESGRGNLIYSLSHMYRFALNNRGKLI